MSTSRQMAWCVWLIASIFYAYQYVLRVMPNILLPDIMREFSIDAVIFGQFSGAYYIGYCLMHLPIGIMLDRFGPKKIMSACILLTVIGLLPIIYSEHWVYPVIGRMLVGVGSSAAILSTFKIIRMMFKEEHFARMLSFSVTIGLIGAIYGGMPVNYLCESYGYKAVVEVFALVGILFAVVTYWIVPEMQSSSKSTILADIKTVLMNRKVLLICFLAGMMVGPMEGFADAWGSEYLKQAYGLDSHTSNYLTSLIYFGMCFAPVLSRIAEKTGHYFGTISLSGVMMLLVFGLLVAGFLNINMMTISFFMVGICCAYQILAIYKASTYVPDHVVGLTTAITNMIIMSFGYLFHSVIGIVINFYSDLNQVHAFSYGISVIPITLLIGAIGFFMMGYHEKNERMKEYKKIMTV